MIALGGVGIISVASNEIPHEMADMTRAALNNDWEAARRIHRKYLPLMQANFIESNPLPVKAALAMMGKIEEVYRLPLLPMRRDTRSKLQKVIGDVGSSRSPPPLPPPPPGAVNFLFTKTGRPDRTRRCCIARPAASAIPVRDAQLDTIPITRAGTALMAPWARHARRRITCRGC